MLSKLAIQNIVERMILFLNDFPRKHFFALIILCIAVLVFIFVPKRPSVHTPTVHKLVTINQLKPNNSYQTKTNSEENTSPAKSRDRVIHIKIKNGDSLSKIFQREGLSTGQLQALLDIDISYLHLGNVQPGQQLTLTISPKNKLLSLDLTLDKDSSITYLWKNNEYIAIEKTKKSIWQNRNYAGTINDTFAFSAMKAGLTAAQAYKIAHVLNDKVNFIRDIHQNDTFRILISKQYIDGKYTGDSDVLAIILKTRNQTYTAFLNKDGRYYDKKGKGLSKAYRRRPVANRYRISSPFNLRRLHPITHKITPHYGTDFAVPTGTRVYATGDGVVLKSEKNHYAAGNYIVIKNSRHYSTRFLHLSKSYVKKGQHVKMGQVIALSGNTGRSTGPHLHYEFRIDNRPVDAMKVDLPLSSSVPRKHIRAFNRLRNSYLKQMAL